MIAISNSNNHSWLQDKICCQDPLVQSWLSPCVLFLVYHNSAIEMIRDNIWLEDWSLHRGICAHNWAEKYLNGLWRCVGGGAGCLGLAASCLSSLIRRAHQLCQPQWWQLGKSWSLRSEMAYLKKKKKRFENSRIVLAGLKPLKFPQVLLFAPLSWATQPSPEQ